MTHLVQPDSVVNSKPTTTASETLSHISSFNREHGVRTIGDNSGAHSLKPEEGHEAASSPSILRPRTSPSLGTDDRKFLSSAAGVGGDR